MFNIHEILSENSRRKAELFSFYDPIRGIGGPLERFEFKIDNDNSVFLPLEMLQVELVQNAIASGSLYHYCLDLKDGEFDDVYFEALMGRFINLRCKYDFEYWAALNAYVKDKDTGVPVKFILNRPQRRTLLHYEKRRLANEPGRFVILKARQWGGSTLTQIYMLWIQTFWREGWSSVICADIKDKAKHIRGMFSYLALRHPHHVAKITLRPYQQSQEHKEYVERDCMVGIGSVENPLAFNAYSYYMAHLSEVGLWKKTANTDPKELVQSISSVIPNLPYTLIVKESTARGVGTLFHDEWLKAESGESGYDPIFVPWFEIERYTLDIQDLEKFVLSMTAHDWELWEKGATLEGIHWYNEHKRSENYDDWRMAENFPSDPVEAFVSSGKRAFRPSYVVRARRTCCDPIFIGDIYGDSLRGRDALKNIKLEESTGGDLRIWIMPPKDPEVTNRFVVTVDIGGRHHMADFSIIKVFDRLYQREGGVPEVAAVWSGHLDQDLVAWKAAQLGMIYNKALVAVEANSLRKGNETAEGDHYLTVLDEISGDYDNLYARVDPEKVREGAPVIYGFHTNIKTKPMIIDALNAALRDDGYVERDTRACDEMDWYEVKPDGSYGAVDGKHDDHVIATAIGVWLCYSYMDLPKPITKSARRRSGRAASEATF